MTRDLIIGVDAGTSVLKSVAFTLDGVQVGVAARPNRYAALAWAIRRRVSHERSDRKNNHQ